MRGGDVDVRVTGNLPIRDGLSADNLTGIFANVDDGGTGNGGNVTVDADSIFMGDGGSVSIFATTLRIEQQGAEAIAGIFAAVTRNGMGRGGNISVRSGDLTILGGVSARGSCRSPA